MKKLIITTACALITSFHVPALAAVQPENQKAKDETVLQAIDEKDQETSKKALELINASPQEAGFKEALAKAYQNHPSIHAALRQYYAAVESIPAARVGWLPSITVSGSQELGKTLTTQKDRLAEISGGSNSHSDKTSVQAALKQNLYQGGATLAAMQQAEHTVRAAQMDLVVAEQQVLLNAITAYLDLWGAIETLKSREASERFNQQAYAQLKAQAEAGEKTPTEAAEAQAQLAAAVAQRLDAEAQLKAAREKYQQAIGEAAPETIGEPPLIYAQADLPQSLADYRAIVERSSPEILKALYQQKQQESAVQGFESALLPSVDASVSGTRSRTLARSHGTAIERGRTKTNTYQNNGALGVTVTIPIYQRGKEWSDIRRANQEKYRYLYLLKGARRTLMQSAVQVWETWKARAAAIEQLKISVRAAALSLEGKRQEYLVGEKTLTDVLDAESRLVRAEVDLITTKKDYLVAAYQLLQLYGALLPANLALPVERHDSMSYTEEISSKLFGTGDLRPVADGIEQE
jgi:outer membrane protein